ncbi:Uroporphyrinogen-Iii Synthase, partial [Manis pentadactyla]
SSILAPEVACLPGPIRRNCSAVGIAAFLVGTSMLLGFECSQSLSLPGGVGGGRLLSPRSACLANSLLKDSNKE